MILDKQNEFSDAQAVTVTDYSQNSIDVGHGSAIGPGLTDMELVIQVDEAVEADGAATVDFSLESDDSSTFGSPTTGVLATGAIGKATLVAGYEVARWRIPASLAERYLRIKYTVASGPLTAGAFSAFLTPVGQSNKNAF